MSLENKIPDELVFNLSEGEKILYTIYLPILERFKRIYKYMILFMIILVFSMPFFIGLFLFGEFRFSSFSFTPLILMIIFLSISYFIVIRIFPQDQYISFTDRNIFMKKGLVATTSLQSIPYPSIRGIGYSRRGSLKSKDEATIEFFTDYSPMKSNYSLAKIPDITKNKQIIESLIFEFGNITDRFNNITQKLNLKFPYTIKPEISKSHVKKVKSITIGVIILIPIFVIFAIYLAFIRYREDPLTFLNFFYMIIPLGLSLLVFAPFIKKILAWRTKACSPESSLLIERSQVKVIEDSIEKEILFTDSMLLDFCSIIEPSERTIDWNACKLDCIIFKESIDSKGTPFGPFTNFSEIYELCFTALLIWKAENRYFFQRDELLQLSQSKFNLDRQESEGHLIGKYSQEKAETSSMEIPEIPFSDQLYQQYNHFLHENEKILFHHKPKVRIYPYTILFLISIASFPLYIIYITFFFTLNDFFDSFRILMTFMGLFILFCVSSVLFSTKFPNKFLNYAITNKQVIMETRAHIDTIEYNNISSIMKHESIVKSLYTYNIKIMLKRPITHPEKRKFNADLDALTGMSVRIKYVPKESNLLDVLKSLSEQHKKSEMI